jgi:hypothetical protein
MSKSVAEKIIIAGLVGEWVREKYHPRELGEAMRTT